MGVLYRAHDAVLERDVALKMMLVDFSHDTAARERFQREARAVARLQHRNVVTIHELGEVEGTPYIVMEFLGGRDLDALLKEGADLTLAKKLEIAAQVCEGLAYAHEQGIVHRDIKPGNVRVLDDGTVKILDFGIAKFAMSSVTQTGTVMGTPSYMAPEQIMGQGIDGRSDLFSAGVLLYELLSGNKPFQGDSPTAVVYQIMNGEPVPLRESIPGLPEAIDDIIGHALQKNPEERYATAKQMATDLQAVRAMIDPQLHTGHTPVLGMPSTGKTAQLSVPLFATQRVRPSTGDDIPLNTGIRPPTIASTSELSLPREESNKTTIIGIGAIIVAAVVGVGGYFALQGPAPGPGATTQQAATTVDGAAPAGGSGAAASGAAAAGAPAARAGLLVVSVPTGASISVNGADTGEVTPSALPVASVPLGSTIELSLKGYRSASTKITDADLKAGNKELRLAAEARPVRLTVTGSYPFELVQGSQVISPSATSHALTVQPSGSVTARNREMLLNQPLSFSFDRAQAEFTVPASGILAVFSAVETCIVSVDGQELGFPPIPRKPVSSGSHTVTLACPDGKGDSQKITVTPGERTQVAFGPPKSPQPEGRRE
jgi:hypothetical protein